MFYKGVLRSYDHENQIGVIYLADLDSEYNFKLSDLPNPSIQPTVGERLKCFVKEVKGNKKIKFIVRLDNNNAPDASYEKLNQLENEEIDSAEEKSSLIEIQKKEAEIELLADEPPFIVEKKPENNEQIEQQNETAPILHHVDSAAEFFEQELTFKQTQNVKEIETIQENNQILGDNFDSNEKLAENIEYQSNEIKHLEQEDFEEEREFFEDKKELSKLKKISVFQKIKNSLTYKKRKPKKEKKKVEIYLNPWILLMIIVVPISIELADRGYKKYNIYQKEQQEKARLYEIEQRRIVEEQRKKLGKLPDKVLSDETLDELLGKDRKK